MTRRWLVLLLALVAASPAAAQGGAELGPPRSGSDSDSETDSETETETETETDSETETETETDSDSETDSETETESDSETETESATGSGTETESATGSGTEASTPAPFPDAPPPPTGEDAPFPAGPAAAAGAQVIVVEAAPYGVDPVVGRHVTQRMRETAAALGYAVVTAEATAEAVRRLRMPYPPSPADLWRVTWVAGAQRGIFARVWAHQGAYVFEISVASLDGAGPFFARGTSGAEDLHEVVDRLTREALPPPDTYDATAAARIARGEPARATPAARAPSAPFPGLDDERPPATRPSRIPTRRWDIALQTESAIGTSSDGFYNHLLGLRLGFRITNAVHLGAYAGYTNLRGRNGRVGNTLFYFQLEDRVRVSPRTDVTVPLRLGVGYLPFNGPFVRLSAGANIPLGPRVEIGFDLLTPTFWVLPNGTAVSLDLAAEVIYRL